MRIFQISDLHLDSNFIFDEYESMLEKMCENMLLLSQNTEEINIVCCGDIVNKGEKSGYSIYARVVFDFIKSRLKDKKVRFIFVPGNHDLCSENFSDFQKFVVNYNNSLDFCSNSVLLYKTPELDFVLINTAFHKKIDYGNVDIKQVEQKLKETNKPVILVMHHTLMNRYENDRSSLSNAYGLLEKIDANQVIGILHGHTHGFSNMLVGNQCRIIGVGSLFKYIPNCNNQFNVIDVNLSQIERIVNYRYHFDIDNFNQTILYENDRNNFFKGGKASSIYSKIKDSVRYRGGINNLYMSLETCLETYKNDMINNFSEDIDLAELWLSEKIPSTLYYNHGSYMIDNGIKGIEYVIEELKRNSTSNRAIIPLIQFRDVLENKYGYLPGLNCIQFGFLDDTKKILYCSIYLRSLEVNRFLRINLSEIYILILNICKEIRSIDKLHINLYAFKAQYKENFSCFEKAEIDNITPGILASILYGHDRKKLLELLKNKFNMQETVINTSGLHLLYDLMLNANQINSLCSEGLLKIIEEMEELDQENRRNSNYHAIAPLELKIQEDQKNYLHLLETIFDEESTQNKPEYANKGNSKL